MWKEKLDVNQLKKNSEYETELLNLINNDYLYSDLNQKDFLIKYNINQGAF